MYEEPEDAPLEEPPAMESVEEVQSTEEEHFDITLAASHSYMGSEVQAVRGRSVLEAGWRGKLLCLQHAGCVFPGETIPLLLQDHSEQSAALTRIMNHDRLFALICTKSLSLSMPTEGEGFNGYGVVCEVFETARAEGSPAGCLARALHRCRVLEPLAHQPLDNARVLEVVVLPEVTLSDPLYSSRLACLDARRHADARKDRSLRSMDAMVTPWPLFVYDIFDFGRMRDTIKEYFKTLGLERMLPSEPVSLSFWVGRNLSLSGRDRLALFTVDNALLRLYMECKFISRKAVVCCAGCLAVLARKEHVLVMSSDGVHSTYTNPTGHMHDIVTVTQALDTQTSGAACSDFSWFPGYSWTVLLCSRCMGHVGWRFDALRPSLRPARFYGLSRNYVQLHESIPLTEPPDPAYLTFLQFRLA